MALTPPTIDIDAVALGNYYEPRIVYRPFLSPPRLLWRGRRCKTMDDALAAAAERLAERLYELFKDRED